MASRAEARCCSRSPRFDPNAMYATSRIPLAHDSDLDGLQRTTERSMRFSNRDPYATHGRLAQNPRRDRLRKLLEVEQGGRFEGFPDLRVHAAVVHNLLPRGYPRGEIDLQRLRVLTFVR